MKYTKEQQTKTRRKKPKAKERGAISDSVYKQVRKRDKNKCVVCGSQQGLECHHVKTRSGGGTGDPSNLVMLCKYHHYVKIHGQGDFDTKKKVFEYLINLGYTEHEEELKRLERKHRRLYGGNTDE